MTEETLLAKIQMLEDRLAQRDALTQAAMALTRAESGDIVERVADAETAANLMIEYSPFAAGPAPAPARPRPISKQRRPRPTVRRGSLLLWRVMILTAGIGLLATSILVRSSW